MLLSCRGVNAPVGLGALYGVDGVYEGTLGDLVITATRFSASCFKRSNSALLVFSIISFRVIGGSGGFL